MNRIIIIVMLIIMSTAMRAQSEHFAITLQVDSAIASEPQKVYLYSMIE